MFSFSRLFTCSMTSGGRTALLAHCGVLSLVPENAAFASRIESLTQTLIDRHQDVDQTSLRSTVEKLRWMADVEPQSCEGHFVEPVAFVGGERMVVTGGDPIVGPTLNAVIAAIFSEPDEFDVGFMRSAFEVTDAVLRLIGNMVSVAGLRRFEETSSDSAEIARPGPGLLEPLTSSVSFGSGIFFALTGRSIGVISPLIHELDPQRLGARDPDLKRTPIIQIGSTFVVPNPTALSRALSAFLIDAAIAVGNQATLIDRFRSECAHEVELAGDLLGWEGVSRARHKSAPLTSFVMGDDHDSACHVILLSDDFSARSPDQINIGWDCTKWGDAIVKTCRQTEMSLFGRPSCPNELLHLVVVASGRGDGYTIGLDGSELVGRLVVLDLDSLRLIVRARPDVLSLQKYARSLESFERRTRILSFSPLDTYFMWKDHSDSFYLGDGPRPSFVGVDGSYGAEIRRQVAKDAEPHPALTPEGGVVEVVRLDSDPGTPIFAPIESGDMPRLLVESARGQVWFLPWEGARTEDRGVFAQIIECLAYWCWQMEKWLPEFSSLESEPFTVEVKVEDPDEWRSVVNEGSSEEQKAIATFAHTETGIGIRIHGGSVGAFSGAGNQGERELARILLKGICEWSEDLGATAFSDAEIAQAVDSFAPFGMKKVINRIEASGDVALWPGNLPIPRSVQPADVSDAFDITGSAIARAFSLSPGEIPRSSRTRVLNFAVKALYESLTKAISTLSPHGLLEMLILQNEAILRKQASDRATMGPKVAAYGESRAVAEMVKEIPRLTEAAVANRFLLELIAAQPPKGMRPFSMRVYDQLMAIASQIFSRGLTSDIIRYELEDTEISYLESGRLGMPLESTFQSAQNAFLKRFAPVHVGDAAAQYGEQWDKKTTERPDFADALDEATTDEWSHSLSELVEFLMELINFARSRGEDVVAVERVFLEDEIAPALGWEREKVAEVIEFFSLEERADFLVPPAGISKGDLWPWRFNRKLSYIRCPLILRGSEVVWGIRHVDNAGRYLVDQIVSDRLKAESPRLKSLITVLRQQRSLDFVDAVYEECVSRGFTTRKHVRKIGGRKISRTNGEDLGDIDVLAVDSATREIHLIECKLLSGARTPAEMHNELERTFGTGRKKLSSVEKHVERAAWVNERVDAVVKELSVPSGSGDWFIRPYMLLDSPSVSPYVTKSPIPVETWDEFGPRV